MVLSRQSTRRETHIKFFVSSRLTFYILVIYRSDAPFASYWQLTPNGTLATEYHQKREPIRCYSLVENLLGASFANNSRIVGRIDIWPKYRMLVSMRQKNLCVFLDRYSDARVPCCLLVWSTDQTHRIPMEEEEVARILLLITRKRLVRWKSVQ